MVRQDSTTNDRIVKTTDDRLQALEELSAHQTAEIESLSDLVKEQWQRIDDLTQALLRLRDRVTEVEESGGGGSSAPVNTPPPHY
ncbi:MAG: SlyX family protein [Pseudomonadota bacterium]